MKFINIYRALLVTLFLFISMHSIGQDLEYRFGNANFDESTNSYDIDIEVLTKSENRSLYSINTRLFFEADLLEFSSYKNFKNGYGIVGKQKSPIIGKKKSAEMLFGLEGSAGYINNGIEIKGSPNQISWEIGQWERLVTLSFSVKEAADELCPSFIWDKTDGKNKGGYFDGSNGVTSSLVDNSDLANTHCEKASCSFVNYNWNRTSIDSPYGEAAKTSCTLLASEEVSIEDLEISTSISPNPFSNNAIISFFLPQSQNAAIRIFDSNGKLFLERSDYYETGENSLEIGSSLQLSPGAYFYNIKTSEGLTGPVKFIKIE